MCSLSGQLLTFYGGSTHSSTLQEDQELLGERLPVVDCSRPVVALSKGMLPEISSSKSPEQGEESCVMMLLLLAYVVCIMQVHYFNFANISKNLNSFVYKPTVV